MNVENSDARVWEKRQIGVGDAGFCQEPPPAVIKTVGIGTRVRTIFKTVSAGLALPHWTIDEAAEQPATPWRYPQA